MADQGDLRVTIDILQDNKIFSSVLDNLNSAVLLIDQTGNIILYNRRFLDLFGFHQKSIIKNVNDREWINWQLFDENLKKLEFDEYPARKAALTGKRIKNQLVGLKLPSAENILWLLINADPLFDENHNLEKVVSTFLDITELIKSNSALKKSEQRYQNLVTASSEVLYIMNADWTEMLRLESKGFLSETNIANPNWMQEYIHPDDRSFVNDKIQEAIKNKNIFELEHRVIQEDGSLGWVYSRAVPLINNDGDITEWFGAADDISRRKEAEEALLASEEKFAAAFRSNRNAFVLSQKTDGLIIEVNDAFLELFGYSREEVIGKNSVSLNMFTDPADRDKAVALIDKNGRLTDYEIRINRKSGQVRTVLLSAEPLHIDKRVTMITTLQDITERKKLEQELTGRATEIEAIMSSSADGIIVFDKEGRIIRYNSTAHKLLCLPENVNDLTLEKRFKNGIRLTTEGGRDLDFTETPAFRSLSNGETIRNQTLLFQGCDEDPRWLNISSAPLIISGTHSGAVVTFSDITHLKKNEKSLQQLNATKDRLFSVISHDLKSPFTSIIGFTELLINKIEKNNTDEILKYGNMIHEASLNTMNLLTNLIEWSKLQGSDLTINPTNFDLSKTIHEVYNLMKPQAEKKSINLTTRIPDNLKVFADSSMISTVIRNLASNAIKFTSKDGQVLISSYQEDNSIIIKVEDNGIGMDKTIAGNLFNNNSKISFRGTENEAGTGLGLLICKEFISKHHGSIHVESEPGKGSKFIVRIPQKISE